MFNTLQEEIEFFSPNPELSVKVESINDTERVAIIDNFWKYPHEIRQLALDTPRTYNPRILHGLPGSRLEMTYYFSHLGELFERIISTVWKDEYEKIEDKTFIQSCFDHASFLVNVQSSDLPPRVPHIDNIDCGRWAAGINLNTAEECSGGTAFYSFRDQLSVNMRDFYEDVKHYDHYILDDDENFKKVYLAEMKFNRMIIYKQNILHQPYILPDTFTDEMPRLMQMFFI
jgi:hypothetical protein